MKKLFTLMLMLFAVIGIQAATPNNLYIFGNAPFGDWVYNPIASGKATQMTKSGNKFTWSGTISSTCYFAFLTQDGSSWDDLNNNYRLSSTTQAISLNTEYALSSGDRSMKLNPGDYTITVDYSSGSPKLKVTGYAPEVVITGYSVIGAKELFGGNGWDTDLDMTESSTGVWTATLSGVALVAGDYEYKARANKEWGVAEYPESGNNTLTISEAGTYNVVFTLTLASSTLTAVPTKVGDETPGVTDLYLVGEFNDWTAQDANYLFTKRADGKFEFTMTGYVANQMFKFVDNNGTWYGSATGANEGLGQDNHENIALATGGMDDNFYASEDGSFTFVVDIDNMTFDVGPAGEEIVEAPEHIYILGGIQGWDPSAGLEMSRTKVEDGKYIYEYTGSFPDENEGNTYFSFTTALASASDAWEEIAGKRYGAYNADEAITADNTDPYDLKAGENAFVLPAGTYRIELKWKESGPDICMWVHSEAAPEVTNLYMTGTFNDWNDETKVELTNNGDGTFTLADQYLDAEAEFKFVDNLGNWYGGVVAEAGQLFWITADTHSNISLDKTAAGANFYLPEAGTYTYNVNVSTLKLDVEGEWNSESNVINIFCKADEAPYLYVWNDGGDAINGNWPGAQMSETETVDGVDYWKATFTDSPINIIFNNGTSLQTPDITGITEDKYYEYDGATTAIEVGGGETPDVDLYLVGEFNDWTVQDDTYKFTKRDDGKFEFTMTGYVANQMFKFVDSNSVWYGSATGANEELGQDNHANIALATGGMDDNFFAASGGDFKFVVNLTGMTFDVEPVGDEPIVEAPEHLYLLGNVQGWDPSNGSAEMSRTKVEDGKYNYQFTGTFPDSGDGNTYFSFTTALASASDAWEEIAGKRYGAYNADEAITADNTDPYDLKAGENAFVMPAGTYRVEINWKEEGPDICMWVHTEAAPEITDLYMIGSFCGWEGGVAMSKNAEGKFELAQDLSAADEFKFVDNLGNWYGANAEGETFWITADAHENIDLNNTAAGKNFYMPNAGSYTFTVDLDNLKLDVAGEFSGGGDQPDVDLYLVGAFNDWTPLDESYKFSKNAEGKFEIVYQGYVANTEFKFVDSNSEWYGSATGANEELSQENHANIALAKGGTDDNFFAAMDGDFKFVVDLANMKFDVEPVGDEPIVEAPEHIYILGGIQGWDPSAGLEMSRTKVEDGKYIYEYTGSFPDENEGNTYFSFTTALASASDAWEEIAGKRYGAYNADEAITADNTDPYDLKAGENAFVLPAGTYRIELKWKESGPDICMWVHTEAAPEITDLYMIGSFCGWEGGVAMSKNAEGKFELAQDLSAADEFKFVDNLGNWYGANAEGETFWITADAHENIDLNNTAAGKNFYMPNAGSYTFTVDLDNLKLDVAGDFSGGGVDAPENLYILGDVQGWDPSVGDAGMNKVENSFTWEGELPDSGDGYSYFSFTSALASSSIAWDEIAGYRYGADSEGDLEVSAGTYNLVKGVEAFKIPAGNWAFTVTFTETGATLTISGEEQPFVLPDCATWVEGKQFAYFEKPASWSDEIYAYTWQDGGGAPVSMMKMSAAWPGDACEYVGVADNGNSVYRYATDSDDFNMIIFNDNNGNQTGDLSFTNGGYYWNTGLKDVVTNTTGITGLENDVRNGNVKAYNLQGMEVRTLGRGIYIINGKKVLRK